MKKGNAPTVTKALASHAMRAGCGQVASACEQMQCTRAAATPNRNAMERHVTPGHAASRLCRSSSVTSNSGQLPNKSGVGLGGSV